MKPMTEEHRQKIKEAMKGHWESKKAGQEIGTVTGVMVRMTEPDRKTREFIRDVTHCTDKQMAQKYGSYWPQIGRFLGVL